MFVSAKAAIIRSREPPRDDKAGILPGTSGASRKRATLARLGAGRPNRGEPFTNNQKKSHGPLVASGMVCCFGPLLFLLLHWLLISEQSLHAMGLYINQGGLHVRTQAI